MTSARDGDDPEGRSVLRAVVARLRDTVRAGESGLIFLAVAIGAMAGLTTTSLPR